MKVEVFTKGKVPERNEDYFANTETSFVAVDGATDKSGRLYGGKTGGEIVAKLVGDHAVQSPLNGVPLVEHLNDLVRCEYEKLGIIDDITDPRMRFTCGFITARIIEDEVVITYLGDLGFRVNGQDVYQEVKRTDTRAAQARAEYIERTRDVAGSRDAIKHLLSYPYQNKGDDPLGFGVIDGTVTPEKFVKEFRYKRAELRTLELFSDGYFKAGEEPTIESWERAYQEVEAEDPDKWKIYKSS